MPSASNSARAFTRCRTLRSEAVVAIDDDHVKQALPAANEKLIELRAPLLGSTDADVRKNAAHVPLPTLAQFEARAAELSGLAPRDLMRSARDARPQSRGGVSLDHSHQRRR